MWQIMKLQVFNGGNRLQFACQQNNIYSNHSIQRVSQFTVTTIERNGRTSANERMMETKQKPKMVQIDEEGEEDERKQRNRQGKWQNKAQGTRYKTKQKKKKKDNEECAFATMFHIFDIYLVNHFFIGLAMYSCGCLQTLYNTFRWDVEMLRC